MKAIILSAGKGVRLRPFTSDRPKCMVKFKDKPIIDYIIDTISERKMNSISIVMGYKSDILKKHIVNKYKTNKNIIFYHNKIYHKTNMVYTLFCAEAEMNDDLIISYADIVYTKEVFEKLIQSQGDICVVVDKDWKNLWRQRMDNPLDDAETLKFDEEGYIKELGKKTISYKEIEGQYIGLIKISKEVIQKIKKFYYSLDKAKQYDGRDIDDMYMTTFLQLLIDNGFKVTPVIINGGWIEIDTVQDLIKLKDYQL